MYGSVFGNTLGLIYFLLFQVSGIAVICRFLKTEHPVIKLCLGSCFGSLLLQWLPILFAFFFDFTITAHLLAGCISLLLLLFSIHTNKEKNLSSFLFTTLKTLMKHKVMVLFSILTFALWTYLLNTHTIYPGSDGSMHCGQCTYGDMNMHLGFITSIAVQGSFPPDYSIFPGTRLAYPFLSDSISSSLYILGASLRFSYVLPMLFAFLQIMTMLYIISYTLFSSKAKAMLATSLYLYNGGLGFVYFLNPSSDATYHFLDIFKGFYTTPTNLVDRNIRWVNVIADILLPQRASLFGYAIAFPCIYLLYRGIFCKITKPSKYFCFSGLFLGLLPMIHTHSFVAVGLIAASWLLYKLLSSTRHRSYPFSAIIFFLFLFFMSLLSMLVNQSYIKEKHLLFMGIGFLILFLVIGTIFLLKNFSQYGLKPFLNTFGLFLGITFLLAIPQLLFWTFGQVARGGFVRGHFNWGNKNDTYLWFYIKNLGLPFLLLFGCVFRKKKTTDYLLLPAGIIWLFAELIVFTPNTYDNNKLLYVAYFLLILAVSDFIVDMYRKINKTLFHYVLPIIFLPLFYISAILTLGREVISDYQIYGSDAVALAEYIESNTLPTDTFLTNTRHVNEIASLTGHNIVCGADTFLYFHGIDTKTRKEDLRKMYEDPANSMSLFEKYHVNYVAITSYERNDYTVDEIWFTDNCTLSFSSGNVQLYLLTP